VSDMNLTLIRPKTDIRCFAGVVAQVESLRGRMGESERQVEGLFESLLSEVFDGKETC